MRKHKVNLRGQKTNKQYLQIPEGWRLLQANEIVSEADQYAHLYKACWLPIDSKDVNLPAERVADYIIRPNLEKLPLRVPEGWRVLKAHEIVSKTDQYAHLYKACWLPVDSKDVGLPAKTVAEYVIHSEFKKP